MLDVDGWKKQFHQSTRQSHLMFHAKISALHLDGVPAQG